MAVDVEFLNGNNVNNINNNFQRVKNALQEVVGRNGNLPNHMNADLDMNSNDILNVDKIDLQLIVVDGEEFDPKQMRGWAPVFSAVEHNGTVVMKLIDYVGGQGIKPTQYINWYVGSTGYVQDINQATGFGSSGVTDGDKGDIVVSGSGANWQIKDGDKEGIIVSDNGAKWELARDRKTVADLLADTVFSYSAGSGKTVVAPGDIITAQGFRYEVAASGASDEHVTTSGGVKLYVLPTALGWAAVAFGVVADGVTDDHAALQKAHDVIRTSGGGILILPEGGKTIFLSEAFVVADFNLSYYNEVPVVMIQGNNAMLTRGHDQATDVVDIDDEEACLEGAALAWFTSNSWMDNIRFKDCKVAWFMGNNPDLPLNESTGWSRTNITMNKFSRIWIEDCAVGHIGFAPLNLYYNSFEDIHVSQCQYSWVMDWSETMPTLHDSLTGNYNRNQFRNVRLNRSWVGLWNKGGATNTFLSLSIEGNSGLPPTSNRYAAPTDVPASLVNTPTAVIMGPAASGNMVVASVWESNDWEIYNEGFDNTFEGDFDQAKCTFLKAPIYYRDPNVQVVSYTGSGGLVFLSSTPNTSARSWGGVTIPAATAYQLISRGRELHTTEQGDKLFMGNTKNHRRVISLGAFTSGQGKTVTLQDGTSSDDYLSDSSGMISCRLVAHSSASTMVHTAKFDVIYQRSSTRGVLRAYVANIQTARSTGINTGDTNEPFIFNVSQGSDTRDLDLGVTAPARAFDRVELFIDEVQTKDKDL